MFSLFSHLLTTFALLPPLGFYASRCIEYGYTHISSRSCFQLFWINIKTWINFNTFYVYKKQFVLIIIAHSHFPRHRGEFLCRSLRFLLCCPLLSLHLQSQSSQQQWTLIFFLNPAKLFLCVTIWKMPSRRKLVWVGSFSPMWFSSDYPALVTVQHMKTILYPFCCSVL